MDEAPATPAAVDPRAAALSASWEAWDEYYRQASRRRRSAGTRRTLREEKRRRRNRERLGLAFSAALVGTLTLVFYLVLR